jgi:hypothetical protein
MRPVVKDINEAESPIELIGIQLFKGAVDFIPFHWMKSSGYKRQFPAERATQMIRIPERIMDVVQNNRRIYVS